MERIGFKYNKLWKMYKNLKRNLLSDSLSGPHTVGSVLTTIISCK